MNGDLRLVYQSCRTMLEEIQDRCKYTELNPFEIDFLDDIHVALAERKILSIAQTKMLTQIHTKVSPKSYEEIEEEMHTVLEDQR